MDNVLHALVGAVLAAMILIGSLDWLGGCGVSYIYADGSVHSGECIGSELIKGGLNHE
jgi:hypothetical protein